MPMDAQTDPKRELAFLREQMHASDQKIARLQNALDNCEDRLESSSLTAMLHAANLERDLLNTVIMRQVDSNSVSLQAVILDQQETIRQAADPQTLRWQRGQAPPPPTGTLRSGRRISTTCCAASTPGSMAAPTTRQPQAPAIRTPPPRITPTPGIRPRRTGATRPRATSSHPSPSPTTHWPPRSSTPAAPPII